MNWFIPRLELAVWRDERGLSSADFGAVSRGKKKGSMPSSRAMM